MKIKNCRVCHSKNIKSVADFGNIKISTFVDNPNDDLGSAPLELLECQNCTLVQLAHTVPPEIMYHTYWYESSTNKVIADNLRDIVTQIEQENTIYPNDTLLDIGANDGTLLEAYKDGICVACEPAKNIIHKLEKRCDHIINNFWDKKHYTFDKAKVVTAIGMFYDMDDPNQFISDIKDVLRDDGIFVSQLMTLAPMLKQYDLGNICHEHLEYYSYKSLVTLFEQNGLEIYKVYMNNIHGGSYQLWARHYQKGSIQIKEPKPDFKKFKNIIDNNKQKCLDFVNLHNNVYIFGASTKGNTIMQYYGLTNKNIKGVAEVDTKKYGKYVVGSKIPIMPETEAKKYADYFLILPYSFSNYFIDKNKDWNGTWVVCTPQFKEI